MTAVIVVSDSTPDPGDLIGVDATGFGASAFERLLLDGLVVPKACLKSDSDGNYATTIVAPSVPEEATLVAQELVGSDWVTMASITFVVGDFLPPPPPPSPTPPGPVRELVATAGDGQVGLAWRLPLSDGGSAVTGYNVYRDGVFVANTGSVFYVDAGRTNGVTYSYQVKPVNAIGEGIADSTASATPRAAPAGTPPDAAAGELQSRINAAASGAYVVLPWKTWKEAATIPPTKVGLKLDFQGGVIDGQGVRERWLTVQADLVHLSSVTMKNALQASGGVNPFQRGSLVVENVDGFQLFQAHLQKGCARGLRLEGGGAHRIIDVEVDQCPVSGIAGGGGMTDLKIYGTGNVDWPARVHDNGKLNVIGGGNPFANPSGPGNEGGGFKWGDVDGIEFHDYEVDHNYGPGFWLDINCRNVTGHDFKLHHHTHNGLFFEISRQGTFYHYAEYDNGWDTSVDGTVMPRNASGDDFGWPSGTLCSSSNDAEFYDFVSAWNRTGVGVIYQGNRGDRQQPARNIYFHDYMVVAESGRKLVTWNQDGTPNTSTTLFTDASNRGLSGDYYSDGGDVVNFVYQGSKTLFQFNGTNGDTGGQYVSAGVRNALLTARGVPLAPSHL